jgi:hypothetical protein
MKRAGIAVIFELRDMVGSPSCCAGLPDGRYVRAVPEPFYDGWLARLRSAWEVICGRAYPVAWPQAGELENALCRPEPTQFGRRPIRSATEPLAADFQCREYTGTDIGHYLAPTRDGRTLDEALKDLAADHWPGPAGRA